MRDDDTRTERTRRMTVENPRQEKLRKAYEDAPTIMTAAQAEAIHKLLTEGAQGGRSTADPIPETVAITGVGARAADPVTGAPFKTLGLMAEDGRVWSVTGAGVCWPGGERGRRG